MLEEHDPENGKGHAGQIALAVAVGIPVLHLLLTYAPVLLGVTEDAGSPYMMIPGCGFVVFQGFILYSVTKNALLANQPTWRIVGIVLGTTFLLDCTCVGLPIAIMGSK